MTVFDSSALAELPPADGIGAVAELLIPNHDSTLQSRRRRTTRQRSFIIDLAQFSPKLPCTSPSPVIPLLSSVCQLTAQLVNSFQNYTSPFLPQRTPFPALSCVGIAHPTMEQANEAFLRSAAILLSPFPSLSSSTVYRLPHGLTDAELPTKCITCRTELILGLNATAQLESTNKGKKMHFICEGCGGRKLVRGGEEGTKREFKKVRKADYYKLPVVANSEIKIPSIPAPPQHPTPSRLPPSIATPPTLRDTSPATPSSASTVLETPGKKKKRSKQPNGLAQLLEEKRRKIAETESSSLRGFLAGI